MSNLLVKCMVNSMENDEAYKFTAVTAATVSFFCVSIHLTIS